jgi:hypothetical protein
MDDPGMDGERGTNPFFRLLAEGDLRGDGRADDVAGTVLADPTLLGLLLDALEAPSPVIRGHTAHAVERVSRVRPEDLVPHLPLLLDRALHDEVPMVRWHLAMVLGPRVVPLRRTREALEVLLLLLLDPGVLVKSWAISSLCLHAARDPQFRDAVATGIAGLRHDPSLAVRAKVRDALRILAG